MSLFKNMHEKKSTNDVIAYMIVVFFTVSSADISKLMMTKPKK